MTIETDLASGVAHPNQGAGNQLEPVFATGAAKEFQGGANDQLRLVKASLGLPARVQGHGHNGKRAGGQRRIESLDRSSQQAPEDGGGGPDLIELEEMNQAAQRALVASGSDRTLEGRRSHLAKTAKDVIFTLIFTLTRRGMVFGEMGSNRNGHILATDRAEGTAQRMERFQTVIANGKAGYFNKRRTADAAIGGKSGEKDAGSNGLCPAEESARCCGLGSPYSETGTAEDSLPPGRV